MEALGVGVVLDLALCGDAHLPTISPVLLVLQPAGPWAVGTVYGSTVTSRRAGPLSDGR